MLFSLNYFFNAKNWMQFWLKCYLLSKILKALFSFLLVLLFDMLKVHCPVKIESFKRIKLAKPRDFKNNFVVINISLYWCSLLHFTVYAVWYQFGTEFHIFVAWKYLWHGTIYLNNQQRGFRCLIQGRHQWSIKNTQLDARNSWPTQE